MAVEYVAFQDKQHPSDWRVEGLNKDNGEIFIALFGGPNAEKRSVEYAMFMNRTHPLFKKLEEFQAEINKPRVQLPASQPAPASPAPVRSLPPDPGAIEIVTTNGHELTIRPSELNWKYDAHRKNLTARPKPAIEIKRGIILKEND